MRKKKQRRKQVSNVEEFDKKNNCTGWNGMEWNGMEWDEMGLLVDK